MNHRVDKSRRADNTRVVAELGDKNIEPRRVGKAVISVLAIVFKLVDKVIALRAHPAAQNYCLRTENVCKVEHAFAEVLDKIIDNRVSRTVARLTALERRAPVHVVERGRKLPHSRIFICKHCFFGFAYERARTAICFHTAVTPARTRFAVHYKHHVPQFRALALVALVQLVVYYDAAAHARAERDEDTVVISFARAELRFAQRRRVGVVGDFDGNAAPLLRDFREREISQL